MRTVKASEVVKGMRVRVEQRFTHPPLVKGGAEDETIETIEGTVTVSANANITFANGDTRYLGYDHPVTVLAEPEPEWVEGAWYWTRYKGEGETERTLRHRMTGGWSVAGTQTETKPAWVDESDEITVLGRVLIVDWPGDDVARELDAINDGNRSTSLSNYGRTTTHDTILRNVADAIRTQGGVR